MKACRLILVAPLLLAVPAAAKGDLGTLPTGRYLCELPGDAAGPASRPVEGQWFDIVIGSRYLTTGGGGTYLLTGKQVIFTRGPLRGARLAWNGARAPKRLDLTGALAGMRCVRSGRGPAD